MLVLPDSAGKILLQIARSKIANTFSKKSGDASENLADDNLPWLHEKGASFVTLTQNQKLRGCIGTLEAHRSLLLDIQANAYAAAFRDPRFSPLTEEELGYTKIEISLLSAMQAITFSDEHDALAQLRPNVDGVVFTFGRYRSTFLPQVWEQLPDPAVFMAHLKHKAGLQPEFWDDEIKLYRYTVSKYKETDFQQKIEATDGSLKA